MIKKMMTMRTSPSVLPTHSNLKQNSRRRSLIRWLVPAILLLVLVSPALAASSTYSFLPVMKTDTIDFYQGYGDPVLSASLVGNQELSKGESATLQFSIANKGSVSRMKSIEYISDAKLNTTTVQNLIDDGYISIDDPTMDSSLVNGSFAVILPSDLLKYMADSAGFSAFNQLATTEMQLEANRINAQSLNIQMSCDSPYIEVLTGSDYVYLSSLSSGSYSTISAPIRINPNTPAGTYYINMTINYEFPDNARMMDFSSMPLSTSFIYSDTYIQEYKRENVNFQIPFVIQQSPVFEITNINGTLQNGSKKILAVTYTNTGDKTAYDAECKIDMMYPLSSTQNKGLLGDVKPGESIVIEYPIQSHAKATPKIYGINSDVRYYDENGDLHVSPSIKLNVEMTQRHTILTFENVIIGVVILFFGAIGYDYYKKRKNGNGKNGNDKNENLISDEKSNK
ncbi:hypothetical protein [Methanolapillus ohkumae]|uniref:S-layer protein n=1 Tax=Methanolapillus ohkumae TaxID=3028298 RepID=A0AA96ZY44_9EURY|nr:hypothetical protein MsAm2_15650 [Methanosarcinaceae archaeon Am2]